MSSITRVAIVENELIFRQMVKSFIAKIEGFQVVLEAENGRDFINKLAQNDQIDLVLLDQSMAPIDGLETLEYLKTNNKLIGKCAILSMYNNVLLVKAALQLGAIGWIDKSDLDANGLSENLQTFKQTGMFMSKSLAQAIHLDNKMALSEMEIKTIKQVCTGKTNKEIADVLYRGVKAVDDYVRSLLIKLGLRNRVELAVWAIKTGFCTP